MQILFAHLLRSVNRERFKTRSRSVYRIYTEFIRESVRVVPQADDTCPSSNACSPMTYIPLWGCQWVRMGQNAYRYHRIQHLNAYFVIDDQCFLECCSCWTTAWRCLRRWILRQNWESEPACRLLDSRDAPQLAEVRSGNRHRDDAHDDVRGDRGGCGARHRAHGCCSLFLGWH